MDKTKMMLGAAVICGCAVWTGGAVAAERWAGEVDLSAAKVYVSTNATVPEVEAAKFLMRAQRMVAGGEDATNLVPAVTAEWPKDGVVVGWLDSSLLKSRAAGLGLKPWREVKNYGDQIVEKQVGDVYVLAGNSPAGAYFAVADLLYRNGARCIHTGEPSDGFTSGTYLEWMTGIRAPKDFRYEPYVANRTGFGVNAWGKGVEKPPMKIGMNQFAVRNGATPSGPLAGGRGRGSIGCESIQPPVALFKKKPEWFPLVDGKRWCPAAGGWITEGCWSCGEFADWVVDNVCGQYKRNGEANRVTDLLLTNSDGGPKCQCADCRKYRAQFPDESSWYFDYHAKLSKRINERIPGLRNYTFAYISSLRYPKLGKASISHLDAIQFCPYGRCYVHPYSDKSCRTNRTDMDLAEEWKQAGIPIGDFDYSYDVFLPYMNLPNWEQTWDVVRYWKELNGEKGVPSIYMETAASPRCGGKSRVSVYTVARALWDCAEAPAETHLRDFCRVAYGEPGKPAFAPASAEAEMLAWYRACAKAWREQPNHLTSTFNNPSGAAKVYFTDEVANLGAKAFAVAEKAIAARLGSSSPRLAELARKQMATLNWERKFAYDEWKTLHDKVMSQTLAINVELGDESDLEFDRQPETREFSTGTWVPAYAHAHARIYRTKDALRIRVVATNDCIKPVTTPALPRDHTSAYCGDHLELFLQAPGQTDYYHLSVAANGTVYDALCKDDKFSSDLWTCDIVQKPGRIQYTLTIPWKLFGADCRPKDGDVYKLCAVISVKVKGWKDRYAEWRDGLCRTAYHDLGSAADLVIVETSVRRAGGK